MRSPQDVDLNFWAMFVFTAALVAFLAGRVQARVASQSQPAAVDDHCVVRLDNRSVAYVAIASDGTVLEFPTKPTKVILGRKASFGIEYVESDLAISPFSLSSRSHLFVYLEGRRFTFDLSTIASGGCSVIAVRDSKDNQVSVDGFFRPKN
ncbi:hypothetical protein WDW37_20795 [Bdellovibrionota bacterium FG-1]